MKKSTDTGASAVLAPRRFNGWGILLTSVGLVTFVFLVIGPMVERNAHLEALDDLEDQERLKRGLLMLCNTQANVIHLNTQLEQKTLEERNRVTRVVRALDCVDKLNPTLQAEYYLWNGESTQVDRVIAQGESALEPAIQALDSPQDEVKVRAAKTLTSFADRLTQDHITRVARRLDVQDNAPVFRSLRLRLNLPAPVIPEPKAVEPEVTPPEHVVPQEEVALEVVSDQEDMGREDAARDLDEDMGHEETSPYKGAFQLREPRLELKKSAKVLYP